MDNEFERIDRMLDGVTLDTTGDRMLTSGWLDRLIRIRRLTDDAYNTGAIAEHEWKALVGRSARIQDRINDRLAAEPHA